jgi:hypothetical protein
VLWHNFVFDADIDRVTADATLAQNAAVFARHPLFVLTLAAPASVVSRLGPSVIASVRLVVACAGALGVVGARAVFLRITADRVAALAFAVLYGLSAAVWLLSSIPETFALSAAAIVGLFLMQGATFARPSGSWGRFGAFVVLSALSIGVTVSNAAYVIFASLANVRSTEPSWRGRARSALILGAAIAAAFLALYGAQGALFRSRLTYDAGLVGPLAAARGDPFLVLGRPLSAGAALGVARAFTIDNLAAPGTVVEVVREPEPSLSGYTQMIQYGDWRAPTYLLAVAALGALVAASVVRTSPRAIARSPLGQLALACLFTNLGLGYFYRANGQPFIFSIHTVLPVLVLLAEAYSVGAGPARRWLAVGAAAAVGLNSLVFMVSVREALALPCADRLPLVCASWATGDAGARYTRGLSSYLASVDSVLDAGSQALDRRDAAGAERFYREALARRQDSLAAERGLGLALWQEGRLPEAIERLEHVLARDPADTDVRKLVARLTHPRVDPTPVPPVR